MKTLVLLAIVALCLQFTPAVFAKVDTLQPPLPVDRAHRLGEPTDDIPVRVSGQVRTDTVSFGFYNPTTGYAVLGEKWTWDHGAADPFEGWTSIDGTANLGDYFRQITAASWAGHGNLSAAPIITAPGSAWLGLFENDADNLCWVGGLGYGNLWCQRMTSPNLNYSGAGGITLAFKYFNDSELNYDYTRVFLIKGATTLQLNESGPNAGDGFTDRVNMTCNGGTCVLSIPAAPWAKTVTAAQMGGAGGYTIRFQFESEGGWSDEDGDYETYFGPFGVDDIAITGGTTATYNFNADTQGWTPARCPAVGSFFAVHDISIYSIPDPCGCELTGNVISFHNASFQHPVGQKEEATSNIVDRTAYISYNQIFADFDLFADLPQANGVFYRPGWKYYPYTCPASGQTGFSPRAGQDTWYSVGDTPDCVRNRTIATNWGIPPTSQYVKFVCEVYGDCDAFGIPSTQCTGVTNATPLVDNVRVRMTGLANAPAITFDTGMRFQDAFGQAGTLDVHDVGNADAARDLHMQDETKPDKLSDSISVTGPTVSPQGTNRWEARLYLHVAREGPAQRDIPRYVTWYNRVEDNLASITGKHAPFTSAWMDSVELTLVQKNRFCSQFRENDDDFTAPEQGEDNEIIWDNMLTPGTKVEYFVTSNFTCTPNEQYLLPDTTGGFFTEFEILPSYRMAGNVVKFPSILYVDAYNAGAQTYIENALNVVLQGAGPGAPIPDPANWDRYDYLDATSNWVAPMFRGGPGISNAGGTVTQLLGYRAILVNTGDSDTGDMEPRDWTGLEEWLNTPEGNCNRRGLVLNGDNIGGILQTDGPNFLNDALGATFICSDYYDPTCPPGDPDNDQNLCVRIEAAPDSAWAPRIPFDVFANWCPTRLSYDVIGTNGGVGNKVYKKVDTGTTTQYAEVVKASGGSESPNNYRSVVSGFSYHHMSARGMGGECPTDSGNVVSAAAAEITSTLDWLFEGTVPASGLEQTSEPISHDVKFYQVDFWPDDPERASIDSDWGDFEFTVCPGTDTTPYYLNLRIHSTDSTSVAWAVLNLAIPSPADLTTSFTGSCYFDLGRAGFRRGYPADSLGYDLYVSSVPVDSASSLPFAFRFSGTVRIFDRVFNGRGSAEGDSAGGTGGLGPPPEPENISNPQQPARTKRIRDDIPDREERLMECGPVSVARSLRWMHKHGLLDLGITTDEDILTILKRPSFWNEQSGNSDGSSFLASKLAVTTSLHLKIVNKFMVNPDVVDLPAPGDHYTTRNGTALNAGDYPTYAFITREFDRNADIEINVGWLAAGGVRDGGHYLTVSGYDADPANNMQQLWIQDDDTQGLPFSNNRNQRRSVRFVDGRPARLRGHVDKIDRNRVELLLSESSQTKYQTDPEGLVKWGDDASDSNPIRDIVPPNGGQLRFFWTMGKYVPGDVIQPHPQYEEFQEQNPSPTAKARTFYRPSAPDVAPVTDWFQVVSGSDGSSAVHGGNINRHSPWRFYPLSELPLVPWKIPDLAPAGTGPQDTIFTAVDLATYLEANPNGFLDGNWSPGQTLDALGVDIVNGVVPGVEGIYWATVDFAFDSLSTTGWVPRDGSSWLNSRGYPHPIEIVGAHEAGTDSTSGVAITPPSVPAGLRSIHPNPGTDDVTVEFGIAASGRVEIDVYDVGGRLVRKLADRPFPAGWQALTWDRRDGSGNRVASGIYLVRMKAGTTSQSRKVLLAR